MTESPERSDQLPEEGAPQYTPDDAAGDKGTGDNPGVPGEEQTGTGNPDAAGSEEPDDDDA